MVKKAVIFDMDGVLVDNNPWHIKAWTIFCEKHQVHMSPEEIISHLGNTNQDYLNFLFGKEIPITDAQVYGEEKEAIYRSIYKDEIKPMMGLIQFLKDISRDGFLVALGTSAPKSNVGFTLDLLRISEYFQVIVEASQITKGKPDPEIFLLAAKNLGVVPSSCIVFEDSVHGVQAGLKAGMKVIGVLTTQAPSRLNSAHFLIRDFSQISVSMLNQLLRV